MFDLNIPPSLLAIQKSFGRIIETPLESHNHLPDAITENMFSYVAPSPTLSSRQRIEIYHQQYWWRLLEILQENFPSVTRLFGYREFNAKIAVPYLTVHPSQDYSLNDLGCKLPQFLEISYHEGDKALVVAMANLDMMVTSSFFAAHIPRLAISQEQWAISPISLQPHIHLYQASADYLTFREHFLENPPEYYEVNSFPDLPCHSIYAIIYRNLQNKVSWKFLSEEAFTFLSLIQKGKTIASACDIMEEKNLSLGDEIAIWFYEWVSSEWLCSRHFD